MTAPTVFVGIDVSKATLDVAVRPAGTTFQVANDPDGIATPTASRTVAWPPRPHLQGRDTPGHPFEPNH